MQDAGDVAPQMAAVASVFEAFYARPRGHTSVEHVGNNAHPGKGYLSAQEGVGCGMALVAGAEFWMADVLAETKPPLPLPRRSTLRPAESVRYFAALACWEYIPWLRQLDYLPKGPVKTEVERIILGREIPPRRGAKPRKPGGLADWGLQ